jgi:hypothetical protein
MKTVEMANATESLAFFARGAAEEPLVVTEAGKPVAVLVAAGEVDLETIAVRNNPVFQEIVETSRAQQRA